MAANEDARPDEESGKAAVAEEAPFKMSLRVQVEDAGPCRKHVRVSVPRDDINHYFEEAVGELSNNAQVPGFRVGRAPRQLIERRFRKELAAQVKQNVLVQSLEQIVEEHKLQAINQPDLDVEALELPDDGDFEYEFDVEVSPEFDLPEYEGLKIKRPKRTTTDADVERHLEQFLTQYAQLVPHEGAAGPGDYVTVSAEFSHNGTRLRELEELTVQIKPVLRFQDAEIENFDKLMSGVSAGDTREAKVTVSQESAQIEMRGEQIEVRFDIHEVKRLRLPEIDKEFLQRIDLESEEELRNEIRDVLDRQVVYQQRQEVRRQVLDKITESANWELPEQLVLRNVENALRREILEMQQAGFTTQQIRARENEIRQWAVTTTRQALKEHFVLDKIATKEGITVTPDDIDTEVRLMAMQRGESPRRTRARLTKSGMIDNLEAQIRERKAVDWILERAKFEDVAAQKPDESHIEAVPQSVCGVPSASATADHDDDEDRPDE
jgi:trigger factor